MDLKYIIRVCFIIMTIYSMGIMFTGHFKIKKAVSTLRVGKEVSKETEKLVEIGCKLVKLGGILSIAFGAVVIFSS